MGHDSRMVAGEYAAAGATLPRRRWLNAVSARGEGRLPEPYGAAWEVLLRAVAGDPDWSAWWERSGVRILELEPLTAAGGRRPRVLRGRASVRVQYGVRACEWAGEWAPGKPVEAAAGDLLAMLDLVRGALALPALPPLPALTALPALGSLPRPADGHHSLPDATEDVVRTLVDLMGIPPEQARAMVGN
jgi:hypothetical protein